MSTTNTVPAYHSGPDFPDARFVTAGDVTFAVYESGPEHGRPVLLLHGWPELAYSWKLVMPELAAAGYRAIAIDMKGFGRSSRPDDVSRYSADVMTDDLARLIPALGHDTVILCGHDWGGALVWPMAYRHPDLVDGVIGICTPHVPRAPIAPLTIYRKRGTDRHYMVQFQDAGLPDRAFGGREDLFTQFIFSVTPPRSVWPKLLPQALFLPDRFENFSGNPAEKLIMGADDRAVFARAYAQTGHRTPTHVYRNIDRNWEITEGIDLTVHQPCLMLMAELDMMLPPELADAMDDLCPDLEKQLLPDTGHWAMWENPEAVNRHMLDWLSRRFPA
ncbi:alpha/beta fold hydrolase [Aquisalinus flavus]|uniref:Epoxide hydrolase n=1 Tax=Aquisalinus flavus TaxID=1526572 RepID=A0A8J2V3E5_9PROT|nr:alpha/beta hydrolase [Aquisalinus flavus]MBD0426804.1 alpha/beta hydrolase [Aquisalinus flavus]UNE46653.1 alpha/beta hydrolase [Aquisalinus flavus]GGC96141.1 epoxide hydrolase [Aquisalinus flavus]